MSDVETALEREYTHTPEVAIIGGGTGTFTVLQELRHFTPHITALINMSDDGGSTGWARDEFGVLPPGDIRQCLVALSDNPEARDIFSYRFPEGNALAGQSLGNIILSGLELRHQSFERAVDIASQLLDVQGRVVPITLDNHVLMMRDGSEVIQGEAVIAHRAITDAQPEIFHEPPATINPAAKEAIEKADLVVIAPGNLYGSLLPALAVNGVAEAFARTAGKRIAITSLVTKPGQTEGWHVADYVRELERYIGQGALDYVLFNNEPPPDELLQKYAADGEFPVGFDAERMQEVGAITVGASLVASEIAVQDPNDKAIQRTLIRHDAKRVGRHLMRIFYED